MTASRVLRTLPTMRVPPVAVSRRDWAPPTADAGATRVVIPFVACPAVRVAVGGGQPGTHVARPGFGSGPRGPPVDAVGAGRRGGPERECRDSSPRVCGARSVASRISAAGACRDRCRRHRPYSRRERTGMSRGSVPGSAEPASDGGPRGPEPKGHGCLFERPAWGWRTNDGGRDALVRFQEQWRSALTRPREIPAGPCRN